MSEPTDLNAPKEANKKGSDTLVVVLMLIALACVGITAAIAFYDMSH
ncbi:MAG: hypothetical protein IPK82_31965 [Polyangiaceae bacterium]|nr:hypothetical protein [Polyangiaceae bacterium]